MIVDCYLVLQTSRYKGWLLFSFIAALCFVVSVGFYQFRMVFYLLGVYYLADRYCGLVFSV